MQFFRIANKTLSFKAHGIDFKPTEIYSIRSTKPFFFRQDFRRCSYVQFRYLKKQSAVETLQTIGKRVSGTIYTSHQKFFGDKLI